jgi:hypothetical protein
MKKHHRRVELERYSRRSVHPTAGSDYTYVLGPPVEPPIWVPTREHRDLPLTPEKESEPC